MHSQITCMKPTQHDVETLLSFPPPYQIKNVTTPEPINGLKNNYEINHKKYKKHNPCAKL